MNKKIAFLVINLISLELPAQTQVQDNNLINVFSKDTVINSGQSRLVIRNNPATDSMLVNDSLGLRKYIVKFKGEPLIRLVPNKLKSARIDKQRHFDIFQTDLNRISTFGQGALKSATTKTPDLKHKYTKAFYGACIEFSSKLIHEVSKLDYVEAIYESKRVEAIEGPAVHIIKADSVWKTMNNKGDSIKVGVIDTGIDYLHPALGGGFGNNFKVKEGYDFVNKDVDPMDDHGHGTHVAGIIAGDNDSITGVAPNAFLYAYKVLGNSGYGYNEDVIAAIELCVDPNNDGSFNDKMDIVNMSLGSTGGTPDTPDAIAVNNASGAGVIFCIGAGNSGPQINTIYSPGSAESAITVGATDNNGKIALFSSRGPIKENGDIKPEIVAPGVKILSSVLDGNYGEKSGTSMATPHVAGVCALLKKQHPHWGPKEMKSALMSTANDLGENIMAQGAGSIDALKACNTKTFILPAKLNFGFVDVFDNTWSKSLKIKIYNKDLTLHRYSFGSKMNHNGMSVMTIPETISINPLDSAEVEVILSINNNQVPFSKNSQVNTYGDLKIYSETDSFKVPLFVMKSKKVFIRFNPDKSNYFTFFQKEQKYITHFSNYSPDTVELMIADTSYWYINQETTNDKFSYKHVENPGFNDTIDLRNVDYKNKITLQLFDEQGNSLDLKLVTLTLMIEDNDNAFTSNTFNDFYISDCFFNTKLEFTILKTNKEKHKIYLGKMELKSVISDTIVKNNIEDYKYFKMRLNNPLNNSFSIKMIEVYKKNFLTSIYNNDSYFQNVQWPWDGDIYLTSVDKDDSTYKTLAVVYDTYGSKRSIFKASSDSFCIFNNYDFSNFYKTINQTNLFHYYNDTLYQTVAPLNAVTLFIYDTTRRISIYPSLLLPEGIVTYAGFTQASLNVYDQNNSEVNSDNIEFYSAKLDKGQYVLKYVIDSLTQLSGKQVKNILTQEFNTANKDYIPANIGTFRVVGSQNNSNNPVLKENERARLQFSVIDYFFSDENHHYKSIPKPGLPIDSIEAFIKPYSSETWEKMVISKQFKDSLSGVVCTSDLSLYTSWPNMFYDVKIILVDKGGNKTTSEYLPCFSVLSSEKPIAKNDYYEIEKNSSLMLSQKDWVLNNDVSGNSISNVMYVNFLPWKKGMFSYLAERTDTLIYQSPTGYLGIDSAKYYIWNDVFRRDSAYIIINVIPNVTEIASANAADKIHVYPNPASERLNISDLPENEIFDAKIVDITGKIVVLESNISSQGQINISTLEPGMYFLNVYNRKNNYKSKVLVKRNSNIK